VFQFHDCKDQRCGGITIPVDVREREPIIGERVMRAVQLTGGVIGVGATLIVIIEKVLTLIPHR